MSDHKFKHTTASRRASVVYGSVGKGGLYTPRDFQQDDDDESNNVFGDDDEESSLLNNEQQPLLSGQQHPVYAEEEEELLVEERELLQDNHLLKTDTLDSQLINETWEEAVSKGQVKTSLAFEMKSLAFSSAPLVVTFLLQNSFSLASIFSVGHIGKQPLAGITLGSMTASITGLAAIQGMVTCLDTLCSQAHGAGKYELVGLHFIRCSIFTVVCFLPIAVVWIWYAENLLGLFVPEPELIGIAAGYMRYVCFGTPGFILFECGKRFLQSQGIFHASSYVLLVCAPLNALMNYLFVWKFGFGYIGAPLAVAINYWLMPLGLLIFALWDRECLKCWPKNFHIKQGFENWPKMVELALPGVVMVEAEFFGFEIITLMASNLGTTELAAQSVLSSVCALAYQIPFSVSIASSTRVANFIGASLDKNAKTCCEAALNLGVVIGLLTSALVLVFKEQITRVFTNDEDVIDVALGSISVVGVLEVLDCLNAISAGCLRGQGLQKFGGYINLFSFYVIGVPLSYLLTFKFNMGLQGLWIGICLGLLSISSLQIYIVFIRSNWDKIVADAKRRNTEC